MGELSGRLATAHQAVDAALQRQRAFEYATKKFSEIHLAPVYHVSRRLQSMGFEVRLASEKWDRIIEHIKNGNWQGISKELGDEHGEMNSESNVNNLFDRLNNLPVTVTIKSAQSQLFVMKGGGGGGYLEPPKQHRVVAIASLALPASANDLYIAIMPKRIDLETLPALENLRGHVLPDQNGYLAQWKPADTDLYFCEDIWFADKGERSASTEFDTLRRKIAEDCDDIRRSSELGSLSKTEVPKAITHSLDRLYDYANESLLANF